MTRHVYALVRCVPDPRTGEFINVGAIAGDPASGDWAVRQVNSEGRARKLASAEHLNSAHALLALVGEDIDTQLSLLDDGEGEPLDEDWLARLYHDHRNVVQLSEPTPIVADDAESALDLVFERLIIDPVRQPRGFLTKHRVLAQLREAYEMALIDSRLVRSKKVEVFVGDRVHTPVDFAIGNGKVVQLAQAWSFQKAGTEELSTQVKSWAYALARVRDGENASVMDIADHTSDVDPDVDIEVVVAAPRTAKQRSVFDEATQVFSDLGVVVHDVDEAEEVGVRAASLLEERMKR